MLALLAETCIIVAVYAAFSKVTAGNAFTDKWLRYLQTSEINKRKFEFDTYERRIQIYREVRATLILV
jgi:hypothetical protein